MKIYIVFAGNEDFGEAVIATFDDARNPNPDPGIETYAIFARRKDAETFLEDYIANLKPWKTNTPHIEEFEVIE